MKEIFFEKRYSGYFKKKESKLKKWTSKLKMIFRNHRIVLSMIILIISCFLMNALLIHRFINILQSSINIWIFYLQTITNIDILTNVGIIKEK